MKTPPHSPPIVYVTDCLWKRGGGAALKRFRLQATRGDCSVITAYAD